MAMSDELHRFVREALARGTSRSSIKETLLDAGWRDDQVDDALASYAVSEFPIPVPVPKPYLSAREAFTYLVLFTTLYLTTFHLGRLLFQFINLGLPDVAAYNDYAESAHQAIRFSVASLVVSFPIFMVLSVMISRSIRRDPSKRASKIRKWLTYMTLFVAAAVIIGDLTALVYGFLGGEMTLRFVLKAATVAVIAGGIFGYYLWDLRQEERESQP